MSFVLVMGTSQHGKDVKKTIYSIQIWCN